MANYGLKQFTHADLTTEGNDLASCVYGNSSKLAGAISCQVSINTASGSLYSDDGLNTQIDEFSNGTITLGVDDDDDEVFANLMGNTVNDLTEGGKTIKEVVSKSSDTPKAVGFGHIITKINKNVKKYKVEFFPKVTFKPFIVDGQTKNDSISFGTPSVEGTIYALEDGTWEKHATFDNIADAQTYLAGCFTK